MSRRDDNSRQTMRRIAIMRHIANVRISALLIAAALGLSSFAAAETKPALIVATQSIEAKLTIDAALKPYPGLYDNLLAEGRRTLRDWRTSAAKDRKETPDNFRDGRRYQNRRAYSRRAAAGRYISILRTDYYQNASDAHAAYNTDSILWDATRRRRISIRPFFKEAADYGPTLRRLAKKIRATLAVEKRKRSIPIDDPDRDVQLTSVKPTLLDIGAVALAPSTEAGKSAGLLFYFTPYRVGTFIEGDYMAFVPWTEFKDDLSPAGAAIFGGARPDDDEKNDSLLADIDVP